LFFCFDRAELLSAGVVELVDDMGVVDDLEAVGVGVVETEPGGFLGASARSFGVERSEPGTFATKVFMLFETFVDGPVKRAFLTSVGASVGRSSAERFFASPNVLKNG
jgi:hypothetical protein